MIKLRSLEVEDISRFHQLTLSFNNHFNLICGANGIGKSTILNVIASAFVRNLVISDVRRSANSDQGKVSLALFDGQSMVSASGIVQAFNPSDQTNPFGIRKQAQYLLYLKPNRDFGYRPLKAIAHDTLTEEHDAQQKALHGVDTDDIKNWLANRWLFFPRKETWPEYQIKNFETAVECFSILDSTVTLSHVDTATYEVLVKTSSGIIPFEYLSSGFRVTYAVLLGLIKEIESREVERDISKFDGIILIDELDLHLHPVWQRKFPSALKRVFPEAQIIATTHSPHMVQSSGSGEVIALVEDDRGYPTVAAAPASHYGYVGWSVEEILQDVMGVVDVASPEYRTAVANFDAALDKEDAEGTTRALEVLDAMLHPSSELRKLFRIQAAQLGVKIDPDRTISRPA